MNFRQTLKYSQIEGGLYALMFASTESFLLFYAVKENVSSFNLAILSTMPLFIGALFQLFVPRIVKKTFLGEAVVLTMLFQSLGVIGIMYTVITKFNFYYLLFFSFLYYIGGLCSTPLWIDWAQRIIPRRNFVRFMSLRNSYTWWLILSFYVSFAIFAHTFSWFKISYIFIVGSIARILSTLLQFMIIKGETHKRLNQESKIMNLIEKSDKKPEVLINKSIIYTAIFFSALFKFSIYISAPFFHPYMLNDLKLTMLKYVILSSIPFLGRAIFFKKWGQISKLEDAFLSLVITMVYLSIIPVIWTFSRSYYYLIFTEIFAGIFWGGYELNQILVISNFIKEDSRKILAIQMSLGNFFAVLGSIVGSYLLDHRFSYFNIFIFSSSLRFCVAIALILVIYRKNNFLFTTARVKTYLRKLLPH